MRGLSIIYGQDEKFLWTGIKEVLPLLHESKKNGSSMIKKVSTLVLLLTVGAHSFPLSSPAAEPARESGGDASLLGEAVDWLALRGEKMLNSARDEIRRLAGLDGATPGTMAEVNGYPISLRQVEALYDMRTAGNRAGQAISLDELRAAYASCLQDLMAQRLVHEELARQGLALSDEEKFREEQRISAGYGLEPGQAFDAFILEEGIDPDLWREQLYARLELELLQRELAASISPSSEDVSAFVKEHPELAEEPAHYTYLSVSGSQKASVEAARNGGRNKTEELEKLGLTVEKREDYATEMPPSLVAALEEITPGQSLPVQGGETQWGYVILLEKKEAHPKNALEMFAGVQDAIRRKRLPALYEEWLENTLETSRIRMIPQLRPRNVPRPAPRPVSEPERVNPEADILTEQTE